MRERKEKKLKCPVCEKIEIYADDAESCLICWMTGRYFERSLDEDRGGMLSRIRGIESVVEAKVWHMGGGGFVLGVAFNDGRIALPCGAAKTELGQSIMVPMIPPTGAKWSVQILREEEQGEGYVGTAMPDEVDDEGLVALLEEIAP